MESPGFILDLEYVLAVFWHDVPCWPDHRGICWPVMLKPGAGEFMAHFWLQAKFPGSTGYLPKLLLGPCYGITSSVHGSPLAVSSASMLQGNRNSLRQLTALSLSDYTVGDLPLAQIAMESAECGMRDLGSGPQRGATVEILSTWRQFTVVCRIRAP